jgi:hypothetical protein
MAKLKAKIAKLEEVDPSLHELYVKQADGTFLLDADGLGEDAAKAKEFRDNNISLQKQLRELGAKMETYKDIDPAKYAEALEALNKLNGQQDANLIKEGKIDEVLQKRTQAMQENFDRQMKAVTGKLTESEKRAKEYQGKLGGLLINTQALAAVGKIGAIRSGAQDDVLFRANRDFQIDETGNVVCKRADGTVVYNKQGEPYKSLEEWAADLPEQASHLFEPAKGSGAPGGKQGDGTSTRANVVDRNDPRAMGRNMAGIAKGTVAVK